MAGTLAKAAIEIGSHTTTFAGRTLSTANVVKPTHKKSWTGNYGGRIACLVAGCRTPFVKSFGALLKVDSIGLGVASVQGLLNKTKLDPELVDHLIWGNVTLQTNAPNIAREVVIDLNLPPHICAHSTSMACSSGMNAIIQADAFISLGHGDIIIAGGSDSVSNAEIPLPRELVHAAGVVTYGRKKGMAIVNTFNELAGPPGPKWLPKMPAVAERSTGKTMGWHADMMATLNSASREDQDAFSLLSHQKAYQAQKAGILAEEIGPVDSKDKDGTIVSEDNLIRGDVTPEQLRKLKPVFRKAEHGGTITAASSSALTDGGSGMLVVEANRAKELGLPHDCRIAGWALTAIDPMPQLLLAPALAIPKALDNAGLKLEDIDVFELHEAFAAQVLSTLKSINSKQFLDRYMGGRDPLGVIPMEKINPNGSSIAIGHPFAATGGRVMTAAVNELRRKGKRYALCSICAAGGLGSVAIIEHDPTGFAGRV